MDEVGASSNTVRNHDIVLPGATVDEALELYDRVFKKLGVAPNIVIQGVAHNGPANFYNGAPVEDLKVIKELQKNQARLEKEVSDLKSRVGSLESKVETLSSMIVDVEKDDSTKRLTDDKKNKAKA